MFGFIKRIFGGKKMGIVQKPKDEAIAAEMPVIILDEELTEEQKLQKQIDELKAKQEALKAKPPEPTPEPIPEPTPEPEPVEVETEVMEEPPVVGEIAEVAIPIENFHKLAADYRKLEEELGGLKKTVLKLAGELAQLKEKTVVLSVGDHAVKLVTV